jgi:hypothetical protein
MVTLRREITSWKRDFDDGDDDDDDDSGDDF